MKTSGRPCAGSFIEIYLVTFSQGFFFSRVKVEYKKSDLINTWEKQERVKSTSVAKWMALPASAVKGR